MPLNLTKQLFQPITVALQLDLHTTELCSYLLASTPRVGALRWLHPCGDREKTGLPDIDRRPQRMIVRHKPPLVARPRDVADTVEHRSQIMFPVRAVFAAEQQTRQHKRPLLIRHIARISGSTFDPHPFVTDFAPR